MADIRPCLWFDKNGEEAARFYASVFPDSKVDRVHYAPADFPGGRKGDALVVDFTLLGQKVMGLNGGPQFPFTEAFSFSVECEDQAEVDRYWSAIEEAGGKPSACGWITDRFGLSWQIVPKKLNALMDDPDPDRAAAAMGEMMTQVKIDIAAIEAAADAA